MTKIRICCIGDSLTAGTADPEFRGWPALACAPARAAGHDVTLYNLGVRGDTSELVAARWRREAEARLPAEVNGALVFGFGVNDCADMAGVGIRVPPARSLATARTLLSEAKVWLPTLWVGPAPVDEAVQPVEPYPGGVFDFRNARIAELSAAYAGLAAELEVPYLDLYAPLAGDPRWAASLAASDGVHPEAEGYALMAEQVLAWEPWRRWFEA